MENITIYEDVENLIKETFNDEETKTDKEYFLNEIHRVLRELYRELE